MFARRVRDESSVIGFAGVVGSSAPCAEPRVYDDLAQAWPAMSKL